MTPILRLMTATSLLAFAGTQFFACAKSDTPSGGGAGGDAAAGPGGSGGAAGSGGAGGSGGAAGAGGTGGSGGAGGGGGSGGSGGSRDAAADVASDAAGDTASDGGSALSWYLTCGSPVCRGYVPTGDPLCTTETKGDPCATRGGRCDPKDPCGAALVCADRDPRLKGCPISSRRFKQDIEYLTASDLARIADDVERIRLATYAYRDSDAISRRHLGFVIEDNPASPAVDRDRDMVDLYGYTSMLVAAVQQQSKEVEALRREVEALRGVIAGGGARGGDGRAVCGGERGRGWGS